MKLRPPNVFLPVRIALLSGQPTTQELRDEKSYLGSDLLLTRGAFSRDQSEWMLP